MTQQNPTALITDMFSQSLVVLSKPSVATFERFEKRGGMQQALIYVGVGAVIVGLFSIFGGLLAFLGGVISTLLGFLTFVFVTHAVGQSQGGTGTLDEVAYTFSLFWMPLSIVGALLFLVVSLLGVLTLGLGFLLLPLVGLVVIAVNVYFGYLAVQSSMNLYNGGSKVWITLVAAALASWLVSSIIGRIL